MKRAAIIFVVLPLLLAFPVFGQLPGSGNAAVFNNTFTTPLQIFPAVPTAVNLPVTMAAWINFVPVAGKNYYPIFSSHNSLQARTGFYMGIRRLGPVWQLEGGFGNGTNNGRRFGRIILGANIINQGGWVHVAAVVVSANDIRLYFNGIPSTVAFFGNANAMVNLQNLGSFIGNQFENSAANPFSGQIDHLSVWNRPLSLAEIRQFMCSKINPTAPGLLLNFDFDIRPAGILGFQSLTGNFVATGGATQVLSGAPIGDTSVYIYPPTTLNWQGQTLALASGNGTFIANFLNNFGPNGFHIYQVNQPPNNTVGIADPCLDSVYYGTFAANLANSFNFNHVLRFQRSNLPVRAWQRAANNRPSWGVQVPFATVPGGVNMVNNQPRREWIFPKSAPVYNPNLAASYTVCNFPFIIAVPAPMGGVLLWSNGGADTIKNFTATGSYTLTYTDTICNTSQVYSFNVVSNTNLNYNPNLPDTIFRCVFPFTIAAQPFLAGSLLWSDSSTTNTFVVNGPGSYSLTATDTCSNSTTFLTVVLPPPPAPIVFNPNIPDTLFTCSFPLGISVPAWAGGTFLWSDSSTATSFSAPNWGNYSLTMRDTCNNTLTRTFTVAPFPFAGYTPGIPDTLFRCVFPFSITALPFAGGNLFWPDSSTTQSFQVTGPGSITLRAVDSCSNNQVFVFFVSATASQPLVVNMPDTLFKCPLDTAAFTFIPPTGATLVTWSNGLIGNNFSSFITGAFVLQVTDTCGAVFSKTFFVANTTFPAVAPLVPAVLQFCKDPIVVAVQLPTGFTVRWFNNSTDTFVVLNQGGAFNYAIIDPCGSVTNYGFQVDTTAYLNYQPGLSDTLFSCEFPFWITANPIANGFLLWPDNTNLDSFLVAGPGVYNLTWGDTCSTVFTQTIFIESADSIRVNINLNNQIANACDYPISLVLPNIPGVQYLWSTGMMGNTIQLNAPGTYTVEAIGPCGVITKDQVTLVALNEPVRIQTTLEWCPGESVFLTTQLFTTATYTWTTGAFGKTIEVNTPGTYVVEIFEDCAEQTETFVVQERDDCDKLYIPNAFTPNDDGKNDVFQVFGDNFSDFNLVLVNRWGQKVFETTTPSGTWNGTTNGVAQPGGVYNGVVRYKNRKGFFREQYFKVTLIR